MKSLQAGKLAVKIYDSRAEMGAAAAADVAACMRKLLETKETINMIFAAAPSQNEVLAQLLEEKNIDWGRVNAFHMDEYIGIAPDHPAGFARFLERAIFGRLPFKSVNYIDCTAADPELEAARYAALLEQHPLDVCILGVGENGHIAFNDPGVADFDDAVLAKVIDLDERSRMQQVNDGCFARIEEVPKKAITVTIPGLTGAKYLYCSVPCATKAQAIGRMFTGEIALDCPATVLRRTPNSFGSLDKDSAAMLL